MDYQGFQSQTFHQYMIPVIVSYTEAFLGKTKNTLNILGKGGVIQELS